MLFPFFKSAVRLRRAYIAGVIVILGIVIQCLVQQPINSQIQRLELIIMLLVIPAALILGGFVAMFLVRQVRGQSNKLVKSYQETSPIHTNLEKIADSHKETELKTNQALLGHTENQKLIEAVSQATPDMVFVIDLIEEKVIYANKGIKEVLGYSIKEVQKIFFDTIYSRDGETSLKSVERFANIKDGEVASLEWQTKHKDGRLVWIHSREVVFSRDEKGLPRQILGLAHDVTEQKRKYELLQSSEAKYRSLVENAGDLIFEMNYKGELIYVNATVLRVLEYTHEEIHSILAWQLVSPKYMEDVLYFYRKQFDDQATDSYKELPLVSKSGKEIWVGQSANFEYEGKLIKTIRVISRDITLLKKAENEIAASERKYRSVVDNIKEVVFQTDTQGRWVFLNPAWEEITGFPINETIGTSFLDYIYSTDKVDSISAFQALITRQKEFVMQQIKFLTKNSTFRWVEVFIRITVDKRGHVTGTSGTLNDVTERKAAEQKLQESEHIYRLLSENSRDLICLHNLDGTYSYLSQAVMDLLGFQPEELIGVSPYSLIHPSDLPQIPIHTRLNASLDAVEVQQYRLRRKDYTYVWMETCMRPILDEKGNIINFQSSSRNISQWKKAENELIQAKEEALQLAKTKEVFLSTMSHEIRTPMNAVIGMTHLLLQEDPKPEQVENLKTLKFSAENLLVLINDILDFNKIEAGKITFEEVDFNLAELINGIKQSLNYKAEEKNIQLKVRLDSELPLMLIGDPVRLSQVLNNLISNAVKFTEEGSVLVDVMLNQAKTSSEIACIDFEVLDTGIGISSNKLEYIFEQFTQASSDTTRKFGGTGLGLAITKRLLELQNSRIYVESALGKGSTFYFSLHFKRSKKKLPSMVKNSENVVVKSLEHVKLLLVEDNEVNQLVATKFLKKWNIIPEYAVNGKIAVEKISTQHFDLVLMDLQMPEMDGFQATQTIRNLDGEHFRKMPIIALTASAMQEVVDRVKHTGMTDYIAKPFNPDELYNKIAKYTQANAALDAETSIFKVPGTTIINYDYLIALTDGSKEFMDELINLYIESIEKFKVDYSEFMYGRQADKLKFVAHKMKASIKMLKASELENEILAGEKLLETDPSAEELIVASVKKVEELCNQILLDLHTKI